MRYISFLQHLKQEVQAFSFLMTYIEQLAVCFVGDGVYLSQSSLPNEGLIKIVTKYSASGNKTACWESLKNNAKDVVCRQLGYTGASSLAKKMLKNPADVKESIFSGSIDCDGGEMDLSQCSLIASSRSCSGLSYIKC